MDLDELLRFVDESVYTKTGKHLKDIESCIIRGSWQGQNYEEIAEERGYTDRYLRQDVGPKLWKLLSETFGERVSKTNFRATLERHHRSATLDTKQSRSSPSNLSFQQLDPNSSNLELAPEKSSSEVPALANFEAGDINLRRDWGEAVDVPIFYGRHENLATIKQWIVTDLCRAVLLLGMGGIGKTSLSIKLAQQIQDGFEYAIWRSLRKAPPIKELLTELVNLLSSQQEIALPESLEQQVSRLLHYLQQQRCLILLDNVESILQGGVHAGSYIPEYEGYGYLFDQIGRIQHQSCLLLTSREKPKEIALLEGDVPRVRSLQLKGLTRSEGQEFFKAKGCYGTRDEELQEISEHYDGNPLALKMVASAVQELAEGDMTEVLPQLRQGRFQFDDINDILKRQWERLSTTEQQVMYWLAINREPVSLSELQADVVSEAVSQQLLAAVQSLGRRSLIERSGKHWTLQPVVMEYVTCHLVEEVSAEIVTQRYDLLRNYALLKAQSKDYVRQAQARFILRLVINRLSTTIGSPKKIEQCLKELLAKLQEEASGQPGYVGGNILNLLCELPSIPIYRRAEVREAIAKGEPVYIVEGEPWADLLWKLGIAATTNIAGGGKFTLTDSMDLQGAERIVILPDRDKKGIEHAEKVAEYFPHALWLYPFPESKFWENLPKDHGLDIADWIEHHNITAEDIKAAMGCKKLTAIDKSGTRAKLSMREAAEQARQILRSEQDELTTNIKLDEIRQTAGISEYVWEHKIVKPLKRDMDAERFKVELLGLLQMDDAVERYRQIALLAPKYSMSAGTIKEAMAAMKSRTQTAEVQVLSFDDLLASESEALEWTVQELLPVGETVLFVALPKVGKSKAAVDLAFCVATGESRFLGREVRQGKVLLISPDTSKQSLKHEMLKRGFRSQDGKNVRIIPRWSIDQMSVLEKELEDFRPDLVIIDSLKKITAGKEISENSAEFTDNIIALNDMLGRYRASGVLIHHASKSNEAVGVAKARGSTAIVGACWGVWDLERIPKPDPNNKKKMIADPKCPKRIFTATSRDSEGLSLNIEFNPENNSFDFISEVGIDEAEAQQQQSYAERILGVLRKNQRPISGPELMELMGIEHKQKGSVYSALGRMESKRLISSKPAPGDKRYNLYSLPDFYQTGTLGTVPPKTENSLPPPPPIPTVPIADYFAESFTQYGFDNSQQNSQQILSKNSECAGSEMAESITLKSVDPIVSSSTLSQGGRG
jgi:RecA-family ATPase/5S rRNA maturation endonuclease (ribonuclease M5)